MPADRCRAVSKLNEFMALIAESRPVIVADSAIPFLRGVLEPWAEVRYLPGSQIAAADVAAADALVVRTRTRCDAALLEGSSVRLIVTATIGFDHIDREWCAAHGIEVRTAAGCNARGVLQWVAAVLAFFAREQGWEPRVRTLGIVGVGHVGSLVREYAAAWGFRVVCCDPPRAAREGGDFVPLEEVMRRADIVTFHTPLDASTRHLANAALLGALRPDAIVLNSSRGPVVDGRALLASGHPFALDVWEHEPHLDGDLLARAAIATPHVAGYSEQGKATATAMSVDALARFFGWPIVGWYPAAAAPSVPRPIAWGELCATIGGFYDIEAESRLLKTHPEDFEAMRDGYPYRREYF